MEPGAKTSMLREMARFVRRAEFRHLPEEVVEALKIRVLDSLGCALGAVCAPLLRLIRDQVLEFGGVPWCTLIGGGRTAPDRAAFYNSALVRYLDFNDSYLAKNETCHPSDNLGAVLAAAEAAHAPGSRLLTALAVAYQVQCRLSDVAPVRQHGFDHVTQGAYSVAAGVSKALELDEERTAHAIAIAGTAFNALRVSRTGALSHWKGLAFPNAAGCVTHTTFLAGRGITGPPGVFEGNKGFMESIAGPFCLDWDREDLQRVRWTILKKYNAEIHSQSAIEGTLELRREHGVAPGSVRWVDLDVFEVAYHIIGGGEEGDKYAVSTKEQADHSLPYLVAVALLDGDVGPAQFRPERIAAPEVQNLARNVRVRPDGDFSRRFPGQLCCRVRLELRDGRSWVREKTGYEGFYTAPMDWEAVSRKFRRLADPVAGESLCGRIIDTVRKLEEVPVSNLMVLLEAAGKEGAHV